jgi:DNA-binding PadR family transcriptional regulator
MFDAAELRLVLLHLMEQRPRHGYDLIREIETMSGGAYAPSPGIIYPTLTMLEDLSQIEAASSAGAKRLFALTEAGKTYIATHGDELNAALARLNLLQSEAAQTEAGPLWRSLQNLNTVLEQRLGGATDKPTLFAAVDLIDETARKIERL